MKKMLAASLCVILSLPFPLIARAEENIATKASNPVEKTQQEQPHQVKGNETAKTKTQQTASTASLQTRATQADYLIPDAVLRQIVNKRLGKTQGYAATKEELATITSLQIEGSSTTYLKIGSFEGLEYLTHLDYLRLLYMITNEEALSEIGKLSALTKLDLNSVLFTGSDAEITLRSGQKVTIKQSIDFSPLGQVTTLKRLALTFINSYVSPSYVGYNRLEGNYNGLGNLKQLESLDIGQVGNMADNDAKWLRNLVNLKRVSFIDSSLSSVESVAKLSNITDFNVNGNNIRDYSPVADKSYFTGASTNDYVLDTQYLHSDQTNGDNLLTLTDIVKVGPVGINTAQVKKFTSINNFNLISTDFAGEGLDATIQLTDLKNINQYNWKTGEYDKTIKGTAVPYSVTLKNGKEISGYAIIPIGKVVTYDSNYIGGSKQLRHYKPFEKIANIDPEPRPGYLFEGWYKDAAGKEAFDFSADVDTNMTLYAKWTASAAQISAKDSEIYVGDDWAPKDNFVSAIDHSGAKISQFDAAKIAVSGNVDTAKAGVYPITYTLDGVSKTVHVRVKADETAILVKNSTLNVGDTWNPADNFVSATTKAGKKEKNFDPLQIQVTGNVDTAKAGVYRVTYNFGMVSAMAEITVKDIDGGGGLVPERPKPETPSEKPHKPEVGQPEVRPVFPAGQVGETDSGRYVIKEVNPQTVKRVSKDGSDNKQQQTKRRLPTTGDTALDTLLYSFAGLILTALVVGCLSCKKKWS
ncbi:cell wall surface anchor family protein [Listeria floridensis FSL S10-1187]|uniref:Cell wall surface anchor family protein n=1 Tax=Listeria floridensis FSL S10-1187 TaxID=1265817 RepID=A0ABN0RDC0_9LIST|nr:bacterial Ig-like domain-containing protein [Listeria floridensis]EUJ28853.1 cell wall surface anchor family protein [Listeria floridensis FSL S10-1187]